MPVDFKMLENATVLNDQLYVLHSEVGIHYNLINVRIEKEMNDQLHEI